MHTPFQMAPQGTNPTAAVDAHPPIKWNPTAAYACRALLFSAMNMGGVCFCAPTRASDNGRCRSSAPEMFFDCGGCLSGAIIPYREHGGAYVFAPLHGRPTMAAVVRSPPKCFPIAADACRALLFPTRNMGGRMQYAPTRMSDNGRCRSFAPEKFSDKGARR